MTYKKIPFISHEEQQQITRLCVHCGLLLMQYGAESTVVVDLTRRLGLALGVSSVECALSFNAITLTTLYNGRCITTTRNTVHQGINVRILVQIGHIVMHAERERKDETTLAFLSHKLTCIDKSSYPIYMVAVFVGLSCAAFALLHTDNLTVALITFLAASTAMTVRTALANWHYNTIIAVIATAFIATLIGSSAYFLGTHDAEIAIASGILLLIPSFPIINALSDGLKGYVNMGVGRFVWASMLSLSACVGIVMALMLLGITDWGLS